MLLSQRELLCIQWCKKMSDLKYYIWLQNALMNCPEKAHRIVEEFCDPQKFYRLSDKKLPFLNDKDLRAIGKSSVAEAERALAICQDRGIDIITTNDSRYPDNMREIQSPPFLIYAYGDTELLNCHPVVSVVGTRKASENGIKTAMHFSYDLSSAGAVVCSGVADGIDSAAIKGAISAGGKTIGVMACSLDVNYPYSERELKRVMIEKGGLLISEYPPTMRAFPENFYPRNRLMSAMADAVLAIEAPESSGTLMTATHAIEQGKEIFAVPSGPYDELSVGTNALIADGIPPAFSAADVLFSLVRNWPDRIDFSKIDKNSKRLFFGDKKIRGTVKVSEKDFIGNRAVIVRALKKGPADFDKLVKLTGLSSSVLTSELISLEIEGYTEKDKAGNIVIKDR